MGLFGCFLSHRGTPRSHPFIDGIFHDINHPFEVPRLWNLPDDEFLKVKVGEMFDFLQFRLM